MKTMVKRAAVVLGMIGGGAGATADEGDLSSVMSEAYARLWGPEEQARIDRDIDRHRKADAAINIPDAAGREVRVEQVSHAFVFGANIFNFDQLGTAERNRRYKALFGDLFNAATIPFYWKTFELEPGRPRFAAEDRDSEAFWNAVAEPKSEPHWRRPAADPIVAFCEAKGIRRHGHTIIWGTRRWHTPAWIADGAPAAEREALARIDEQGFRRMSPDRIAAVAPAALGSMRAQFDDRVAAMAAHYGDRLQSWDVVNESAVDYRGRAETGDLACASWYGLMPGDYTLRAYRAAGAAFPRGVGLFINDYANNANYAAQVNDLRSHGCRIDAVGSQMHLIDPGQTLALAEGKAVETPEIVRKRMETLGAAGLPIHVSEITITAPGDDDRGRAIQAVAARNLYRLWFSTGSIMGITWWNIVDDCGAPGEPTTSGLFTRDMQPKPSYHALDRLINGEWTTRAVVRPDARGSASFRGFKGRYRASWVDAAGAERSVEFDLLRDGDGPAAGG